MSVAFGHLAILGLQRVDRMIASSRRRYAATRDLARVLLLAFLTVWASGAAVDASAATARLRVATVDSGFGGFLSAKAIELAARPVIERFDVEVTIKHYGDTLNAPYGARSPTDIAQLGTALIVAALDDGADIVFVACNTISTQETAIREVLRRRYPHAEVQFIITATVEHTAAVLDAVLARRSSARLLILATPATAASLAYPNAFARRFGGRLVSSPERWLDQPRFGTPGARIRSRVQSSVVQLPGDRELEIVQVSPGNWVQLIERGASADLRSGRVRGDLVELLRLTSTRPTLDVVGYFCTHYPIVDPDVRRTLVELHGLSDGADFVSQGSLVAAQFTRWAGERLAGHERPLPLAHAVLTTLLERARPSIVVTGDNVAVTRELARTMYPDDVAAEVSRFVVPVFDSIPPRAEDATAVR